MKNRFFLLLSVAFVASALLGSATALGQWAQRGLSGETVDAFTRMDSLLFAGTTTNGIYRSQDDGATWQGMSDDFDGTPTVFSLASIGTVLFAGTQNGLFLSTDSGQTWSQADTSEIKPGSNVLTLAVERGTPMWVLAGVEGVGVVESNDTGTSWSVFDNGLSAVEIVGNDTINYALNIHAIAVAQSNAFPTTLFAGTESGLYLSTSGGATWSHADNGITTLDISALATTDSTAINPAIYCGTLGRGIFLSTDNGLSWNPTGPEHAYPMAFELTGSNVYAGMSQVTPSAPHGIFLSTNNGGTWSTDTAGLGSSNISALYSNGTFLFAGTDNGVFSYPLTVSDVAMSSQPNDPISAYPNPFLQSTTLRFSTTESGAARVSVIDALGREVAILFDGPMESGQHEIAWNPGTVPPGVYWCALQMNGAVQRVALVAEN